MELELLIGKEEFKSQKNNNQRIWKRLKNKWARCRSTCLSLSWTYSRRTLIEIWKCLKMEVSGESVTTKKLQKNEKMNNMRNNKGKKAQSWTANTINLRLRCHCHCPIKRQWICRQLLVPILGWSFWMWKRKFKMN